MQIPYDQLSAEALNGILEEFVLREGTDYGSVEYSNEQKIEHVRSQLLRGVAAVFYDQESDSCTLKLKNES